MLDLWKEADRAISWETLLMIGKFLLAPLEPDPEGRAFAIVNELFCVPGNDPGLVYTNPERTQYTEGVVAVRCSYRGEPGSYMTALWVSRDWSMTSGNISDGPRRSRRFT